MAVAYHRQLDWDRPSGPSFAIEPFDLAADVADNAGVAVAFATQGLREFAGVDVEVEGIARVVGSAVRSP
jgi:hypothetical protein